MKKVYLETYGCQMNVSDSERVATSLSEQGFTITQDADLADVVLINTCSVREKAEQKLYSRIGRLRREDGNMPVVGVLGCVAQLEGETLFSRNKNIDFVIGTKAVGRVADAISKLCDTGERSVDLGERDIEYDWSVAEGQRHSPYVSFVPIIEGCNKFCTYCIVPFSRGREQSFSSQQIIDQVRQLNRTRVREVHLIGQNVNSYRPQSDQLLNGFSGTTPFAKLLRGVAQTGIDRIKFTTSFPRDFRPDIVDIINEYDNICNWVHLPVQSGSDRVLKGMRRGHTIDSYFKKIDYIKSSPRDIALTTDIIVGFPGESEREFLDTVKMVEYCEFDSAYIFKYSPRPGTPAFEMKDDVAHEEKTRRFLHLERVQKQSQNRTLQRYLGKRLSVLAERVSTKSAEDLTGHSTCHKVVNFKCSPKKLGTIVDLRITEVKSNSFYGEVC